MARAISHLRKRDSATGKSNLFHVNEEWSMCRTSGNTEGKNSHGTVNKSHAWLERVERWWCSVHSEWFICSLNKNGSLTCWGHQRFPVILLMWPLHRVPQKCLPARDGSLLSEHLDQVTEQSEILFTGSLPFFLLFHSVPLTSPFLDITIALWVHLSIRGSAGNQETSKWT